MSRPHTRAAQRTLKLKHATSSAPASSALVERAPLPLRTSAVELIRRRAEVLVVGDNENSEIAAANRLGIPTVQILRPGVPRATTATHVISTLAELPALLRQHA